MIMKPNNWDSIQEPGRFVPLPAGGYIVVINGAELKTSDKGYEYLDLIIDICEGEYKDYYSKDFYAQEGKDKRWRGHYIQGTPKNGEKPASFFKGMIRAIEESNPGYTWNWDERSLVGRIVGCLFREEEYEKNNGETGVITKAAFVCGADRIRQGDFKVPQRKTLPNRPPVTGYANGFSQPQQQMPSGFEAITDDNIPF